jgi:hypothetical protein
MELRGKTVSCASNKEKIDKNTEEELEKMVKKMESEIQTEQFQ